MLASRCFDIGHRLPRDGEVIQRPQGPKVNWRWEHKGKKEEMIGIESLTHPMTIINHVVSCIIIAIIINFLMKMYL